MTTYAERYGGLPLPSVHRWLMEHFGSGAQGVQLRQPALVAGSGPTTVVVADVAQVETPWPGKISHIKAALGLSISQLASALQVQRPTIYSWLDEEEPVEPRENNKERIDEIHRFAEAWSDRSSKPALKIGHNALVNGHDLVWYLDRPQIDSAAVEQILDALARIAEQNIDKRDGKGALVANLRARGFAEPPKSRSRR